MDTSSGRSSLRRVVDRLDRAGLVVIAAAAALVALASLAAIVVTGVQTLGSGPLTVRDLPIENPATPAFTEPLDAVTAARYESVEMTVEGVSGWARALLWAGEAVAWLTVLGICVALVWLCVRISRQRPFGRSVTTALNWVAVLVIVGGTTSGVLADFGRGTVVAEVAPQAVARSGDSAEGFVGLLVTLDLAPIGIGLALGVVAAAFGIGTRMQRDVEGLV